MRDYCIDQLDYRYILIDSYKDLKLNENELVVLLLIDQIERRESVLISPELLALKTNLSVEQLDLILASLHQRNYIEFISKDNKVITSLEPLYTLLLKNFKDAINHQYNSLSAQEVKETQKVYAKLQEEFGRTLSPIEMEKIKLWLDQGLDLETIVICTNKVKARSKRISINQIDKEIVKYKSTRDIEKEGYTSVDDKYLKDIEETIKIANVKWSNDDE